MEGRTLQDDAPDWHWPFAAVVIFLMFAALLTDRFGTDSIMVVTLTTFVVTEIITIREAASGFSNTGLLSVVSLFMVAEGISRTGALDWYMGKILGAPKSVASAQLRLMIPLVVLSAFLNNTPIVVVMTPIVLRWAENNGISPKQLLIPLSYGSIFGGTCTLIGTSTNLVVSGLLTDRYPNDSGMEIGFFDLGTVGVPLAMVGIAFILLASPWLLPDGTTQTQVSEDVLLKARVTKWSSAAGRTIHRSGLRDTGGIYLVSVLRSATGNVHHAVPREFVLSEGDILYFTGLVEEFGAFCEDHGLEVVTNETEELELATMDAELGSSKESLLTAENGERLKHIYFLADRIHGVAEEAADPSDATASTKIVVAEDEDGVIIGIDALDRDGLLLDISKAISRLDLSLQKSESVVKGKRSVSLWFVRKDNKRPADIGEIWTVLESLLGNEIGVDTLRNRGSRMIRARIIASSSLVGRKATEVDFRDAYRAAVVAVLSHGKNMTSPQSIEFEAEDILILQAQEGSPLLANVPATFYNELYSFVKQNHSSDGFRWEGSSDDEVKAWKDLEVISPGLQEGNNSIKEFVVAVQVHPRSGFRNKTVGEVGIDRLPGVRLLSIERGNESVPAADVLDYGDVIWFAGDAGSVGNLRKVPGLSFVVEEEVLKTKEKLHDRRLIQAVVSRSGTVVGKTAKELKFRTKYGAVVIAVQRQGKRIYDHPGNIKLHAGDVLLLEAGTSFMTRKEDNDFQMLAEVADSSPPRIHLLLPSLAIVIGMIVCFTTEVIHLITAALIATILMVVIGVMTEKEARESINWEIYVTIACAFGIGSAMVNSGLAKKIADFLVKIGDNLGIGDAGAIFAIYFSTFVISNIVTNNAAAALIFPVAMDAAELANINRISMAYAVMFGASACFASPFGYQTNLIVFGPGGYTTADFLKFGAPLQIVFCIVTVCFLVYRDTWFVAWIITAIALLASTIYKLLASLRNNI